MNDIGIGLVANMIILEPILSSKGNDNGFDFEMIEKGLHGIQCGITENFPEKYKNILIYLRQKI